MFHIAILPVAPPLTMNLLYDDKVVVVIQLITISLPKHSSKKTMQVPPVSQINIRSLPTEDTKLTSGDSMRASTCVEWDGSVVVLGGQKRISLFTPKCLCNS